MSSASRKTFSIIKDQDKPSKDKKRLVDFKLNSLRQRQQKKKQAGNNKHDNAKTAAAGLKFTCSVCRSPMPDPKTYKQHLENKHPKAPMPAELKDVAC